MQNSSCESINTFEEKLFEEQNKNMDVKIRYPQIKIDENPMAEKINKTIEEIIVNKYYKDWDWV